METKKSIEEESQSTPDVKPSSAIKIGIFIVIALVIVIALYKINNSNKSSSDIPRKEDPTVVSSDHESENYTTLNLLSVDYNSNLTHTLQAGQKVKILLTRDYCPIWTSANIDMYQDDNSKRVICGTKIIQGPKSTSSLSYLFHNTSSSTVIIKVGRSQQVKNFKFS